MAATADELAAIVCCSEDAIVGKRLDGIITSWNPAAERLYGYTADEAIGRNAAMLLPSHRGNELEEILDEIAAGRPVRHFETQRVTRDGRVVFVSISVSPIEENGAIVGAATIARDVTLERDRLWQSQKMESLGRLAGGVAHDFNNLLVVIRGYAELVGRDCNDPNARRVREIIQTTDHGAALTRQLLLFSKDGTVAPIRLDLNKLVDETAHMLRRLLNPQVELAWDPAHEPALTKADPTQLQQVLINLVVNASDAMPSGGTIRVATRHVQLDLGPHVLLTVADTGTGIDPETLGRIFDPFFTTKPVGHGTGLGLSTVYGIVRRHNGFVSVDSRPGEGTTFGVNLPAI